MRIKIGDNWYNSADTPIMVELSDQDKQNIADMLPECSKYCQYDEVMYTVEQIREWMNE